MDPNIYGLSATLYHAIAGTQPPSAIERTLEDAHKPLAQLAPAGFDPGILAGIDAGSAVRAVDRPQSIAAWRGLLQQKLVARGETVFIRRPEPEAAPPAAAAPPQARRSWRTRPAIWLEIAAAFAVLAGGGYLVNGAIEGQRRSEAAVVAAREQADETARQVAIDARKKSEAAQTAAQLERSKAEEAAQRQQVAAAAAAQKAQDEKARKDREAVDAAPNVRPTRSARASRHWRARSPASKPSGPWLLSIRRCATGWRNSTSSRPASPCCAKIVWCMPGDITAAPSMTGFDLGSVESNHRGLCGHPDRRREVASGR